MRPPDDSPAVTAAIVLAVQSSVAAAIEASLGTAIEAAIKTVRTEIASNHGHVTKRLFPELEKKIASLETSLATKTMELEDRGVSLLAKVSALDDRVSTTVEKQLATLEASPTTLASRASGPREPPDAPPDLTAFPGCMGVRAGALPLMLNGTMLPWRTTAPVQMIRRT